MFTQQSGQIENALRGAGVPDISAKEMMQGVANCQSPLEHRGGVAFTRNPRDNRFMFPGMPPTGGTPSFYVPPSIVNRQQIINFPPWQHVPWTPIPYPEQEKWQPIPYPEWPGGQYPWDDTGVIINSPTYMGPVNTTTVNTEEINSTTINNEGDITNQNAFFNEGPMIVNGPVNHNHNVINRQNVTNKKTVVNEGDVYNESAVYNSVAYNYSVTNYGGSTTYGPTTVEQFYSSGPNEFAGDTYIEGGDVFVEGDTFNVDSTTVNLGDVTNTTTVNVAGDTINLGDANSTTVNVAGPVTYLGDSFTTDLTITGDNIFFGGDIFFPDPGDPGGYLPPLAGVQVSLVTDVEWDGTNLIKKYRTITLLGSLAAEQDDTVVSGTSCPSTPLNASAGNLVDMP